MSFFQEKSVLLISEDLSFSSQISDQLTDLGLKVILSNNEIQAIEIFCNYKPHIVLTELKSSKIDGLQILKYVKKQTSVPVLVIAPESDIMHSGEEIQKYGGDYISKPVQAFQLHKWFNPFINSDKQNDDDESVLNTIGMIHTIKDIKKLLETVSNACIRITNAKYGLLHLYDRESKKLRLIFPEDTSFCKNSVLTGNDEWAIPNWVFFNGQQILVNLGTSSPEIEADLYRCGAVSALSLPIKAESEIIAIMSLFWGNNSEKLSDHILNNLKMLLYQAGIAFDNIMHMNIVNQKLDELMLVSTYSEKLMGLVDKYDVIKSLFETTFRFFPIDVVGFLIAQKRQSEFLYWSREIKDEKTIRDICSETVCQFNEVVKGKINEQRVKIRKLPQQEDFENVSINNKLSFNYVIPVCWDELKFGAVYFGATRELINEHEKKTMLMSLVSQTRIALNNSRLYSDMKENYIRTIKALAIAVDAKDTYTHGHSENVMNIAEDIAREMGIDEKSIGIIRDAGLLHDIGKIGIPGYILNKPGPLTHEEFNGIMKTHSTLGANIVKEVPFLYDLHKLILYHHEHFNGDGYPESLKGEQIPIGARILHVADAFEAMTSNRPYRCSLGRKEAYKRLIENCGLQFDPSVIKAFIRVSIRKGWIDKDDQNLRNLIETLK